MPAASGSTGNTMQDNTNGGSMNGQTNGNMSGMNNGGSNPATAASAQIVSSMPPPPAAGPAPDFAQLANGKKSISAAQAAAYPPLANDFARADKNRDGHISKAEYDSWKSH
jgi:hypothetical protein